MRVHIFAWAVVAATVMCGWAGKAEAAMLSGSVITSGLPGTTNLTTEGLLDWAFWDTNAGTGVASFAPTNTKDGGPGAVSPITAAVAGTVRGGNQDGTHLFSYTDGDSPASRAAEVAGPVFNASLGASGVGRGVQISITGDPGQAYVVNLWATGFQAQGTLTATLDGAAPVVLASQNFGTTKDPNLFTFIFQPDDLSDLLNLSFVMTSQIDSNSHVGFQAVTISPVPEPGTWVLAAAVGLGGVGWWRRRGR